MAPGGRMDTIACGPAGAQTSPSLRVELRHFADPATVLLGQKVLVVQSAPGDARALRWQLVQLGAPKRARGIPVADGCYVEICWKLLWVETILLSYALLWQFWVSCHVNNWILYSNRADQRNVPHGGGLQV